MLECITIATPDLGSYKWKSLCIMIYYSFLSLMLLPAVFSITLPLNIVSNPNVYSPTPLRLASLSTTRLTTNNNCFYKSTEHSFVTTKPDCEGALDILVKGKSLVEPHYFGYKGVPRITDQLPVGAQYGTCSLVLLAYNTDSRIMITYAEIYAELLGPDGLIKDCVGPDVPFEDALGGQTAMGPGNMLVADVMGRPFAAADQKIR